MTQGNPGRMSLINPVNGRLYIQQRFVNFLHFFICILYFALLFHLPIMTHPSYCFLKFCESKCRRVQRMQILKARRKVNYNLDWNNQHVSIFALALALFVVWTIQSNSIWFILQPVQRNTPPLCQVLGATFWMIQRSGGIFVIANTMDR